MPARLKALWNKLFATYWFVPALMCGGAFVLAEALLMLDTMFSGEDSKWLGWTYGGSSEGARETLAAIASSSITVAGVAFSITIVALTLATQQFGPGLLENFMRDRGNQVVLGTFTSTYLYSLLVIRKIHSDRTPELSVTTGVMLAVAGIGVLIYFIHHVASSIQVNTVVERVGGELDKVIDCLYPERVGEEPDLSTCELHMPAGSPESVPAGANGYIQRVEAEELVRTAKQHNIVVRLRCKPGDYLVEGQPMMEYLPAGGATDEIRDALSASVVLSYARTPFQDVDFAIQKLTEIALRALSPSMNDPFSAILCVDRLSASLMRLRNRSLPQAARLDEEGKLRLIAPGTDFQTIIATAFDQIRLGAQGHPRVEERIRSAMKRLREQAQSEEFRRALA